MQIRFLPSCSGPLSFQAMTQRQTAHLFSGISGRLRRLVQTHFPAFGLSFPRCPASCPMARTGLLDGASLSATAAEAPTRSSIRTTTSSTRGAASKTEITESSCTLTVDWLLKTKFRVRPPHLVGSRFAIWTLDYAGQHHGCHRQRTSAVLARAMSAPMEVAGSTFSASTTPLLRATSRRLSVVTWDERSVPLEIGFRPR